LFEANKIDADKHSIVYGKFSRATVKEHKEACNRIIKEGTFLQIARAKCILESLEGCDDNEWWSIWYVGETIRTFQERMDEDYPWAMKMHGVTHTGVIAVTPSKSKTTALILEACVAGLFQHSAGGHRICPKYQLNLNIVQCGGRFEYVRFATADLIQWLHVRRLDYGETPIDNVPGVECTQLQYIVEEERPRMASYIKNRFGVELGDNESPTVEQMISYIGYRGGAYIERKHREKALKDCPTTVLVNAACGCKNCELPLLSLFKRVQCRTGRVRIVSKEFRCPTGEHPVCGISGLWEVANDDLSRSKYKRYMTEAAAVLGVTLTSRGVIKKATPLLLCSTTVLVNFPCGCEDREMHLSSLFAKRSDLPGTVKKKLIACPTGEHKKVKYSVKWEVSANDEKEYDEYKKEATTALFG
jgi:hypothetical protein